MKAYDLARNCIPGNIFKLKKNFTLSKNIKGFSKPSSRV